MIEVTEVTDILARSLATLAVAALLGAGAAAAQAPAPQPAPVPALHGVWFDAAALADDEVRGGLEAYTIGRFTLGATIGYSHTPHPRDAPQYVYAYPMVEGGANPVWCGTFELALCAEPSYYYGNPARYRAWTAALTARFYPASFSFRNGASRMMVYAGAHAGYRWSTWDETVVYYCTNICLAYADATAGSVSARPPRPSPADSVVVLPPNPYPYPPIWPGPNPIRHSRGGFEPGLDVGVRLLPFGPLFVEVGGRFTLVTADDPMRRTAPGDVESRLVLAAGLAW